MGRYWTDGARKWPPAAHPDVGATSTARPESGWQVLKAPLKHGVGGSGPLRKLNSRAWEELPESRALAPAAGQRPASEGRAGAPDPCWTAPGVGRSRRGPGLRPAWKDPWVGKTVFGPGPDGCCLRAALGDTVPRGLLLTDRWACLAVYCLGTSALKHVPRGQGPPATPAATPISPLPRGCAECQAQPQTLSALAPQVAVTAPLLTSGPPARAGDKGAGAEPRRKVRAEKDKSERTA